MIRTAEAVIDEHGMFAFGAKKELQSLSSLVRYGEKKRFRRRTTLKESQHAASG
jgi:hypothetical protein